MRALVLLVLVLAAVAAAPNNSNRIMGGTGATIAQYPQIAALLYSSNLSTWTQACGGVIINTRSVLTTAHCPFGDAVERWRFRVGIATSNLNGVLHTLENYTIHPQFNHGIYMNNDIAIFRSVGIIAFNLNVMAARFAGTNYRLPDNAVVWAAGWGRTSHNGPLSASLRHVQMWTIYQKTCIDRYREVGLTITDNMLCSGWLDVGGRDQCLGDDGGPLYHEGVVVGVFSFNFRCGAARYPGVNTRVSRYQAWIEANADADPQFVQ